MKKFLSVFLAVQILFSSVVFADSQINWDPNVRPNIRMQMSECRVFLAPMEVPAEDPTGKPRVDDTVGIPISSHNPEEFKAALKAIVETKGLEKLKGSRLYVTGVIMSQEREAQQRFDGYLKELGLDRAGVTLQVMSVPDKDIKWLSTQGFKKLFQRLKYFFPSMKRDYQTPTKGEVISGLVSTVAVEAPNVVFLYSALPPLDANVTVLAHAVVLTLYSVYKKFMINWLLRPGSSKGELLFKQLLMSAPFVLNYNVLGHLTPIMNYYNEHGWQATLGQFPKEMAAFTTTQGLTVSLQTLFYSMVVTNGVRTWENRQVGAENSTLVRTVANVVLTPILAADAYILAMAASIGSVPWFNIGPMVVNSGHVWLSAMTLALGATFWVFPDLFNPTLKWYRSMKNYVLDPFNDWFAESTGIDIRNWYRGKGARTKVAGTSEDK